MAWVSPLTFVAGSVLTAAQLNTHLRDNLNETAPAKATGSGQIFVSTGANAIAARMPSLGADASSATATSTGVFGDPVTGTAGPAVIVTTGIRAIVFMSARISNSTATGGGSMGYAVTGASTIAADSVRALVIRSTTAGVAARATAVSFLSSVLGLNSGSNTFTAKYTTPTGGTATFLERELMVIPL